MEEREGGGEASALSEKRPSEEEGEEVEVAGKSKKKKKKRKKETDSEVSLYSCSSTPVRSTICLLLCV